MKYGNDHLTLFLHHKLSQRRYNIFSWKARRKSILTTAAQMKIDVEQFSNSDTLQ